MPYLEACIKETLRLLPPLFRTDRTCVKDWQEDGLFIPKGWLVSNLDLDLDALYSNPGMNILIPTFAIHHDPSIWPEPESFRPERFFKEVESTIQACSWLPFGGGPRQCIASLYQPILSCRGRVSNEDGVALLICSYLV